jgi:DEAD/DEAH box helicase domain-containing protein
LLGDLLQPLSPSLQNAIASSRGIERLYSHQAKAINELSMGKHVIVSTATASGKSLIYQIPVLASLEQDPTTKALYIFPTKALAQDQKKSLQSILSHMAGLSHIQVETFDGDTPQSNRTQIRESASGMSFCCIRNPNDLK